MLPLLWSNSSSKVSSLNNTLYCSMYRSRVVIFHSFWNIAARGDKNIVIGFSLMRFSVSMVQGTTCFMRMSAAFFPLFVREINKNGNNQSLLYVKLSWADNPERFSSSLNRIVKKTDVFFIRCGGINIKLISKTINYYRFVRHSRRSFYLFQRHSLFI